jgi:hypothetical protein
MLDAPYMADMGPAIGGDVAAEHVRHLQRRTHGGLGQPEGAIFSKASRSNGLIVRQMVLVAT